jgi:hypothetical protein
MPSFIVPLRERRQAYSVRARAEQRDAIFDPKDTGSRNIPIEFRSTFSFKSHRVTLAFSGQGVKEMQNETENENPMMPGAPMPAPPAPPKKRRVKRKAKKAAAAPARKAPARKKAAGKKKGAVKKKGVAKKKGGRKAAKRAPKRKAKSGRKKRR